MLQAINDFLVETMDYVLGWLLYLPRDLRLVLVAVLTSAILAFVRLWTTDQDWLGRASRDQKRLKGLIRQARRRKDKQAVRRFKQTLTLIKLRSLKFEGKPLLASIVPIALLATWCFARLGYEPPRPGETVELRLYVPAAAIGKHAYVVRSEGLQPTGGWIATVEKDAPPPIRGAWDAFNAKVRDWLKMTPPLEGVARWRFKTTDQKKRYRLRIRYDGKTYEKELLVGTRRAPSAVEFPNDGKVQAIELALKRVKLFGVVGGLDIIHLPPWLVAYLIIAIPFVTVFKRVFKIY